jgi:hypothetical protein
MNKVENNRSVGFKGEHIITTAKATSDFAIKIHKLIDNNVKKRWDAMANGTMCAKLANDLAEEYTYYIDLLNRKYLTNEIYVENVTCTVGRTAIANVVAGVGTYTGVANYCAVGTGTAAASEANTQLGTETFRKLTSTGVNSSNIIIIETFFEPGEATATLEEYGYFINGNGSANSGQLLNRFTQTVTKTATESLNVRSLITLSDA